MATSETVINGANADPAAATETLLYTSPSAGAGSVISSIVAANRGAGAIKVRIGIDADGTGPLGNAEYLVFDHSIDPNDSLVVTGGITMAASAVIRVESDLATASFSVFGMELGS